MKYIRTKDGIYTLIIKDKPIYELNGKKYYCVEERISSFVEDEVIKQADTIEELCDEFVIETDREKYVYNKGFRELQREYDVYDSSYGLLKIINKYGAIWTDKGLIYVAKMNEKGELELL